MNESTTYVPPKVWVFKGATDYKLNRPTSGARFDKELPVGRHPLQLYSLGSANGIKVTFLLEELLELGHTGAEYDAWLIDISPRKSFTEGEEGQQFSSGFVAVNPNSKIPALLDRSFDKPVRVFESGAIMAYLSRKFDDAFMPADPLNWAECQSWMFWQTNSAVWLAGCFGHFYTHDGKNEYAINRFTCEVKRQLDLLNKHLAEREYMLGDVFTLADICVWPWWNKAVNGNLYNASEFLQVHEYTHLKRWADLIGQRPAAQRGSLVNRVQTVPYIRERHDASDYTEKLVVSTDYDLPWNRPGWRPGEPLHKPS